MDLESEIGDRLDGTLDPGVLETLRQIGVSRIYPSGVTLIRQGETESTFYVVEHGHAVVSRRMEDGHEHLLAQVGPRQSFGEMALIDNKPRLASVTTVGETTVLEITVDQFRELIKTQPDLALYITRQVLANLRKLDRLAIEDLRAKNVLLEKAYRELQAAQAELVEKERLEREMELAAEMQRNLLPATLPSFPDFRFAAYLAPAYHVGGDLYDVREVDDEHLAFLIADVADKGVHAALLMAVTRTLFYQEATRSLSPAAVVGAVHRGLLAVGGAVEGYGIDAFVTAFYGLLHRPSGRFTYVRAAQDRPLLIRPGQSPMPLPGDGRFLGMIEHLVLEEHHETLRAGDYLLLYSDGVTDATNESGERYGLDRLLKAIAATDRQPVTGFLACLVADVNQWRGPARAFDDVTMLLVEAVAAPLD